MAYQSLYRKYRSKDFGDLVGQHHVTQTLANAITADRVAHAYLFCGPRGTGKTSTARVLAKAVNCAHGPTATPCDVCPHCIAIRQGSALDVIEIDAASNRNIDDMRQLREQVNYPPVELNYKFYIVDEVHQLTRDAFNAFLKTLEEPPGHVIFVLCTTDPHQLPATILSRCQRFDFHRITLEAIADRLRWVVAQEGWTVEDEALFLLARSANGGLRDALSLLDQAASYAGTSITAQDVRDILGGIDLDLLLEFSDLILRGDASGLFTCVDTILSGGKDVPQMVAELTLHWRNLLRATIGGADVLVEFTPAQREQLVSQAALANQSALMRAINLWCEAENELRWNSQQRLLLELYSLRIMNPEAVAPVAVTSAVSASAPPVARPAPKSTYVPAPSVPIRPAAQQPVPPPTAMPAPPAGEVGDWTLPRVKKSWAPFVEWMSRSPKLEQLRVRIVEKCQPSSLLGNVLTLSTSSAFTRSQLYDRPKVKEALEQCIQSFFHAPLLVEMEVTSTESEVAPTPLLPAEGVAEVVAAASMTSADPLAERMQQVFQGSQEIT